MYRSALVGIKPAAASSGLLESSISLAQQQQWELECVSVVDADFLAPPEPVPVGGGAFKQERDRHRVATARQGAENVVTAFQAACTSGNVAGQAQVEEGDAVKVISRRTREHDLLIVGHSGGDDTDESSRLVKLLRLCSRPALVVPQQMSGGNGVIIAYDGSVQAARTLATLAYSGLAVGRKLWVAAFDADEARAKELAAEGQRFLARHDLSATIHTAATSANIADLLIELARNEGAGLLAMGAFGTSSVREFFFGSVTRSVLRDHPIPLLFDH